MRIKWNFMRLLVPVVLFAGMQAFAQSAAGSQMPAANSASPQAAQPHAVVLLISDRTFLMKSLASIAMDQSSNSQPAGAAGCASRSFSGGASFARPRCPIIDCAAPPPGCFYQGPPATDQNGCPINCGTLVCGGFDQ
jgi:hypothetical protein